ncbi:MAG: 30S ribosomal protein S17 [Patescibacteria group bacterium]|nr:30S ribosomal protein S17 [Patescibacteria group bacterium]
MAEKKSQSRVLQGTVVSDKMAKTVVVRVDRMKMNPKYQKQYRMSQRFKVHDEKGESRVGDVVRFTETRPLSKGKRWRVIGKVAVK